MIYVCKLRGTSPHLTFNCSLVVRIYIYMYMFSKGMLPQSPSWSWLESHYYTELLLHNLHLFSCGYLYSTSLVDCLGEMSLQCYCWNSCSLSLILILLTHLARVKEACQLLHVIVSAFLAVHCSFNFALIYINCLWIYDDILISWLCTYIYIYIWLERGCFMHLAPEPPQNLMVLHANEIKQPSSAIIVCSKNNKQVSRSHIFYWVYVMYIYIYMYTPTRLA